MIIMGIDPGSVSGAFAIIDTTAGSARVGDLPVVEKNIHAAEFARSIGVYNPDVAVVERVNAFPKQGVSSVFAFGRAVGIIHGVLAASDVRIELVTPTVWKKFFKLGRDKEASRALAIRLFPQVAGLQLKKHSDRAEALLMAHWYKEHAK